ncbi:MAG: glycosyltransferase family 1 protein [Terracidiphilus sp.]|nr:glycosyltransferase family 1 protein [Terracidiphilus sp.]
MKVLLVGNYKYDGSMSMQVWASALERELSERDIDVRVVRPRAFFGRLKPSADGIGKWLGYIDRFLIFPLVLRWAARKADVVHICDHSYSMYSVCTGGRPTVVTCHDLLAVRGALGELTDCPASRFGRILQHMILRGLENATKVVCVSKYTYEDAQRLLESAQHVCVILNGLNYAYRPLDPAEIKQRLAGIAGLDRQFVLHIGSNLPRKNREGILRTFAMAVKGVDLQLVFSGVVLNQSLMELARELGIEKRIVNVSQPDVRTLEALYSKATLLIFPSRFEGFGWPPIEAQACGCPVVASSIPPLMEVLGDSAVIKPLDDEAGMAEAVVRIATDELYREELRKRGFENVHKRFGMARMIGEYITLYMEFACRS